MRGFFDVIRYGKRGRAPERDASWESLDDWEKLRIGTGALVLWLGLVVVVVLVIRVVF